MFICVISVWKSQEALTLAQACLTDSTGMRDYLLRVGLLPGAANYVSLHGSLLTLTDCFPVVSLPPMCLETEITLGNMNAQYESFYLSFILLVTCCVIAILHKRVSFIIT